MKLLRIAVGLAILTGAVAPAQDLPDWVLQLSRVKRLAKTELVQLPDFACMETISRFERKPNSEVFKALDTIRLDVALVGGKELVAPAGGNTSFQEMDVRHLAYGGAIGTGAFAAVARNLFVNDNGRTTGMVPDRLLDKAALRFNFVVSATQAGYTVSTGTESGSVGLEGEYWADADTLMLMRIDERATDIPPELRILDTSTSVSYAMTRIGSKNVLLPRQAQTIMTNIDGTRWKNEMDFSACREYVAESTIRFDTGDAPKEVPKKK